MIYRGISLSIQVQLVLIVVLILVLLLLAYIKSVEDVEEENDKNHPIIM